MSRRRKAQKRDVAPDVRYGSVVFSKFVNSLMYDGKRSIAENMLYKALDILVDREKAADGLAVLTKALDNVRPTVEVRSRRIGGATYQVPVEVSAPRAQALAIRWLIKAARLRSEHGMVDCLAGELGDACKERGGAFKKKEDTHKMAEANRAFSHYRW